MWKNNCHFKGWFENFFPLKIFFHHNCWNNEYLLFLEQNSSQYATQKRVLQYRIGRLWLIVIKSNSNRNIRIHLKSLHISYLGIVFFFSNYICNQGVIYDWTKISISWSCPLFVFQMMNLKSGKFKWNTNTSQLL